MPNAGELSAVAEARRSIENSEVVHVEMSDAQQQ